MTARSRRYVLGGGATVRAALRVADEYVWIYSETPRWWTDAGPPAKLPEAYAEALRRAKGGGREPLDE